jgi:MFS family permease
MNAPQPMVLDTELSRRRWQVLILSSIGMFVGTMLTTIVAIALPRHLAPDLALTYSEALWVQAIYPLTMSICLIPVGRLGQKSGLLRFYLLGMALFGLFSIACGLAFNGAFLIAARCLQATGGAITAATSMALVTSVFPPQERGRGLGISRPAPRLGVSSSAISVGAGSSSSTCLWCS